MRRPALRITLQVLLLACTAWTEQDHEVLDGLQQRESVGGGRVLQKLEEDREVLARLKLDKEMGQVIIRGSGEPMHSQRRTYHRNACGGRQPCPLDSLTYDIGSNLNTFPPGRPTHDNIGNICNKSRSRISYGSHNLPQSGYAHLSRQGNAINYLEEAFSACCQKSDKLQCAVEAWQTTLLDFCESEFRIKTRPHHCCLKSGSERENCFSDGSPNPSYISSADLESSSDDPTAASPQNPRACPPNSKCQENLDSSYKLSDLAFPPGEPKSSNIKNICKLRKYRTQYTENQLPASGFSHYVRRAKAIQRMEGEFKKCCKSEDVACAHSGWKKVLGKFCAKEQLVKTKHHECCKKADETTMLSCFSTEAPFPEYDREVEVLNLGSLTEDDMQKLCGEAKLLTKQKQMPLLVSGLRDTCCTLAEDQMVTCVAEQREMFIKTLCGDKKNYWKDTQDCCSKEQQEREQCFTHYLQNISMAISRRAIGE